LKSKNLLQGHSVYATEEGREKLLKILQFYDFIAERESRSSLPIEDPQAIAVAEVLEQLGRGVPPQYILGRAFFMGNTFYCTSDTLIPRPETSLLVKTAYEYLERNKSNGSRGQTVIEIGTGCGNIAVSLAMLCGEDVRILASDISEAAVEVARRNVQKYQADGKVSLFCGDLYEPFAAHLGAADMVLCNPPYIPTTSLKKMAREIIDHEPVVALDGGPFGLGIFRRLLNGAPAFLKRGGALMFEIGERQEKLIERLFAGNGAYGDISFFEYQGKVRVVAATKK
jgi:release factor glutamine methyltransferase